MQTKVVDVFDKEYTIGDIIAYAKHGGFMCIFRVKKINKSSLSCYPITKSKHDGLWREQNDGRTTCLQYPSMGMIINDNINFPYTETPEPSIVIKTKIVHPGYRFPDDDDDDY